MSHLQIEQAIFTSADKGTMKGYQLVARSPGIDRALSQQLCRWSPSHGSLNEDDLDQWVLSTFPLSDGRSAVARTIFGGPEYSGRGGIQVVTQLLVVREDQFASYQCNAFALAQTAITLGEMRFCPAPPSRLPVITLPDQPLVACVAEPHGPMLKYHRVHSSDGVDAAQLMNVLQRLHDNQSVAVIGSNNPIKFASHVIERIPSDERPTISITTGLEPTLGRPFRLHFLPQLDSNRQRVFESLGVQCVSANADAEALPVCT
tara:strand:+ start:29943 stop:30725 length:783 start_codon:yes stop_codon:yes gene_type:complete